MKKAHQIATQLCLPEELETISRRQLISQGFHLSAFASAAQLFGTSRLLGQDSAAAFVPQRKLIWINMRGGWDILETVDPKERDSNGVTISYPWEQASVLAGSEVRIGRWLPRIAGIGQDVVVVRGLAMGTTSHDAGSIYMETGVLSNAGRVNSASIPAIIASESQATIPIIQLNGGSDAMTDRGLLKPVSVVRASNLELYQSMYPTEALQKERRLALLDYLKGSITRLTDRVGSSDRLTELAASEDKIRGQFESDVGLKLQLDDADRSLFTQGLPQGRGRGMTDTFALAYKLILNDLVTCVNLGIGGFDTHSNQSAQLEPILTDVDFLIARLVEQLRAAGKLDSTLIVLYSDFGRTPKPNNSNGRDHWPVGGAMLIGGGLAGGRAVGATDEDLRALDLATETGQAQNEGEQLNPTHIGGSVLELTLGAEYLTYRPYLTSIPALTRLKG